MAVQTISQGRRITLLLLCLYSITLIIGVNWLWQVSYQNLTDSNQQQLDRFSRHLDNQLGRFAYIPRLLSRQAIISKTLKDADNTAQLDVANYHLQSINNIIGASDTYLLDAHGTTIAASNWSKETTFIGNNFAFRPYYQDAMQGKQGQYFALGSRSGERGYYFSYPVSHAAEILGVIVVKMDLSLIEKDWMAKDQQFLVTDNNNVVFISSNKNWLFHSLTPLTTEIKTTILNSRRYLSQKINSLSITGDLAKSSTLLTFGGNSALSKRYLSLLKTSQQQDWTIRVLAPITPILINITMLILFISLFYMLLYLIYVLIKQKQSRHEEQVSSQAKAKQQLEFQVMRRTSALHAEIDERQKAERALRSTQKELIQSAKLAVLGQLSASISHELNNPLAAIRSYAENAIVFLERDSIEQASNNLTRISALTERMAKISSQLKSFARKSNDELTVISLQPVLLASHELLKGQLKTHQSTLTMNMPDCEIHVKAEPIQLEQIVVNLLSNALQAMEDCQHKDIRVNLFTEQDQAIIEVMDTGVGIKESDLQYLFEPFFTTKKTGLGLGLSISQQIMTNMHGIIEAKNRENHSGAIFTIRLPIHNKQSLSKEIL